MIEPFLLTATRISTFRGSRPLTNASGFFFARDGRLILVTSRHVVYDEPSQHFPDRLEIELHIGLENVACSMGFSMPLYRDGKGLWRVGLDAGGDIDVAVIEVDREALPSDAAFRAFTPQHLAHEFDEAEAGTPLLVIGFPLGFHDTLHHMPVVRHAIVASSFGLRFQGQGYFLTDSRTHRGSSGSPIVARMRVPSATHGDLPWTLVGVHSARIDIDTRDLQLDEALGLNVAWYADILLKLTEAAD